LEDWGRLQVPLYLRGDECFFGGHQKLGEVLGHCWSMKIDLSPPIILFYGDEELYWGFVRDALMPDLLNLY
jgi:hypothetical protein